MDMVNVTIDGVSVQVPSNYTVLEAAKQAGIKI
ncbi:MAG: (2Fe-2S)-binding protein, partial [Clostridiales bacterium]|nr:(2Fe-2S)-binding protein [Clostridiales bacterium]